MKREVNLKRLLPLTLMLIALSVSWHIGYLQSSTIDTGTLVYRRMAGTEEQLVGLTPITQYMFDGYDHQCLAISRTGTFIVTSTPEGTDLIVRRFSTGEVIRQFSSQSNWAICTFFWINDAILRVKLKDLQEFVDLNVFSGTVSSYIPVPYVAPTYPQLSDRVESQPVFPTSNGDAVLYERCLGPKRATSTLGEILCTDDKDWVIYDMISQQIITTVTRPGHVYLRVAPYESRYYATGEGISWSPDGRYLASVTRYIARYFPLQLVDVTSGEAAYLDFANVDVNVLGQDLFWSPNSQKLAFWVEADLNNVETESSNKTLVFYDTLTESFMVADQTLNPRGSRQNGQWAPDGSAFAYVDENSNLVHVDVVTGATNLLDSNIVHIELWAR